MSYRNDHDAALNRITALESELAALRGEPKNKPRKGETPEPESRDGRLLKMLGVAVGATLVIVGLVARAGAPKEVVPEPASSPDVAMLAVPVAMDSDACVDQLHEWAARDARAADPRGPGRVSAATLMRGPVACGQRGHSILTWEEQNVSSLITVYYENDPVTADGYASAEQLWFEYHRARTRH